MGEVLPFTEDHAEGVASVYLHAMRGQNRNPPRALADYFCEILLRNPWADPDIPSLVYRDQGKIAGVLGVIPRPMLYHGKPVRMAVATQMVLDTTSRNSLAGLALLRRYFSGPQELTWTDGAADAVHHLWQACGGRVASLHSFQWIRFLRPFSFAAELASRKASSFGNPLAWLARPFDGLAAACTGSSLHPPKPEYLAEAITPQEFYEDVREMKIQKPLSPALTEADCLWQFDQIARGFQPLRLLRVTAQGGAKAGWAVYYAPRGRSAYLFFLEARRNDLFPVLLRAVFWDAWQQGCHVVRGYGYGVPSHNTTLTEHSAIFRHPGSCALVHSRDQELVNCVLRGDAALTRLDGECWLRFGIEAWV